MYLMSIYQQQFDQIEIFFFFDVYVQSMLWSGCVQQLLRFGRSNFHTFWLVCMRVVRCFSYMVRFVPRTRYFFANQMYITSIVDFVHTHSPTDICINMYTIHITCTIHRYLYSHLSFYQLFRFYFFFFASLFLMWFYTFWTHTHIQSLSFCRFWCINVCYTHRCTNMCFIHI